MKKSNCEDKDENNLKNMCRETKSPQNFYENNQESGSNWFKESTVEKNRSRSCLDPNRYENLKEESSKKIDDEIIKITARIK